LERANLNHANLTNANWGVDMKNQPMGLMRVTLNSANLSYANLTNANLSKGLLKRVDLSHANLTNADLSGADLTSARFDHANFTGANLNGTRFSVIKDKTIFTGAINLNSAIFEE
jgi:uncharacterized protein YjbI with pentapeptide repeats